MSAPAPPRPSARPFLLGSLMAAPLTQGAAPRVEEDVDGTRSGAGVVSDGGEYRAPEMRAIWCHSLRPGAPLAPGRTSEAYELRGHMGVRARRAGPEVPAGSEAATRWGLSAEGRAMGRMAFSAAREVPWAVSSVCSSRLCVRGGAAVGQVRFARV